jgi:hypothetical protein
VSDPVAQLTAILSTRLPATDPATIAAAVTGTGVTRTGLTRFVRRLADPVQAGWPASAMSGEVAFLVAVALQQAGVIEQVPDCGHCGRARPVQSRGAAVPTCQSCGPRRPDGLTARIRRPSAGTTQCPAGVHQVGRGQESCVDCRHEHDAATIHAATIHAATIHAAVMQAGANIDYARTVTAEVLPGRRSRQLVAAWLTAGGSLADPGSGAPMVQRLRNRLATDLATISRTTCPRCRRTCTSLRQFSGGQRVCLICYQRARGEICRSCRRERGVAWRDEDGWPWCPACRSTHPDVTRVCVQCGQVGPVARRSEAGPVGHCCYTTPESTCLSCEQVHPVAVNTDDGPLCKRCSERPPERCVRCGNMRWIPHQKTRGRRGWCVPCLDRPMIDSRFGHPQQATADHDPDDRSCVICGRTDHITYLPDAARCGRCQKAAMRRRETCNGCGHIRRVFFDPGLCADCLGVDVGGKCTTCGLEDRLYEAGQCERCVLTRRVHQLLGDTGPGVVVADRLAASTRPASTLRWLADSPVVELLHDLLHQPEPLTHADLDAIKRPARTDGLTDRRQSVENARLILVACEILPRRNELSHRYETWAHQILATIDRAAERMLAQQFHLSRILPSIQARCRNGKATYGTIRWAQTHLRGAADLMAWCRPMGGITALNRADIDTWFADSASHYGAREFLLWTIRQRLVDLPPSAIPRRVTQAPAAIEDHQVRADLVRGLLHEDGYRPDIRVAGLLVALYGQHLSRIVRIERHHVQPDADPPRIQLGTRWLDLPEQLGTHLNELVATGPRRQSPFTDGQRWLFPGYGAGAHLSARTLGHRLAEFGIPAAPMRNMALFQLAATLQPSTLAQLLGLHPGTAVRWVNESGGIYANYWSQFMHDQPADDPDLVEHDEPLESEDDPLDLLDELGIQ